MHGNTNTTNVCTVLSECNALICFYSGNGNMNTSEHRLATWRRLFSSPILFVSKLPVASSPLALFFLRFKVLNFCCLLSRSGVSVSYLLPYFVFWFVVELIFYTIVLYMKYWLWVSRHRGFVFDIIKAAMLRSRVRDVYLSVHR